MGVIVYCSLPAGGNQACLTSKEAVELLHPRKSFIFRVKQLSGCWLYVIGTTLFTPTPHVYTQTLAYDVIHRTSLAKNKEGNTERG